MEYDSGEVEVRERNVLMKGAVVINGIVLCTQDKKAPPFKKNKEQLQMARQNGEKVEVDGVYCSVKRLPASIK